MATTRAVITSIGDRPRDTWSDPARGKLSWFTLLSGDITPTGDMSAGIADYDPGDELRAHRHAQSEIYYIVEGEGLMTIEGQATRVTAGTVIFIPGDAEHGIRNEGDKLLRLFYVFPTASFADVVYRFSDPA
jgi:quercetin dioxygenase-like cupin family protein